MKHQEQIRNFSIIFIIYLLLVTVRCIPVEISITNNQNQESVIYNQSKGQSRKFSQDSLLACSCSPDSYKQIEYSPSQQNYILIKNVGSDPIDLQSASFYQSQSNDVYFSLQWINPSDNKQNQQYNAQINQSITIQPNQSVKILQVVQFPTKFDENNYWVQASLDFVFSSPSYHLNVIYTAILDSNYKPTKFDWVLLVLISLACIMIYFFARFGQIYAFKTSFCGYKIEWWWGIVYSIILTLIVLLVKYYDSTSVLLFDIIISAISIFCCYFFMCEVFGLILFRCRTLNSTRSKKSVQIFFFQPFISKVRGVDFIGAIFSLACVSSWYFIKKPWFMNDILSVAIMSCTIKFFKITSMKSAAIFMGITLLYDTVTAILIHYSQSQSYDSLILAKANYPFELQIPSFKHILDKKCAWIAITSIVLPGFFLQYLHRFDKSRNSQVYAILGFSGLFLGSILWVLATIWNIHTWPFACFTYPLIYLFVLLFAQKRAEVYDLWSGKFHDPELLNPLTLKIMEDEARREEQDDYLEQIEEQNEEAEDDEEEQCRVKLLHNNINNDSMLQASTKEEPEKVVFSKAFNSSANRKTKINIDSELFYGLQVNDQYIEDFQNCRETNSSSNANSNTSHHDQQFSEVRQIYHKQEELNDFSLDSQ
ncbi:signal peptide peptidase (macronuclear) [Tetrahymena thermophila SB210]|uniref:Signal peptide peptidase n=1 Tax=Tetrahymena thermophila (strain SB210) TaxID=312017 RepID=Q22Y59_TETTS|nr:signal peptide peptidase [Tetrahymena thermophila SB210]EAR90165.1 signal peptide peptidase [Tetrahymena thermophila SB210]|eukprot:XP_001010410.1 signal peptide peptidase [Tetrahymena thermophila SB210]